MRIYEAYDNPSIRVAFKKYIEAEGVSVTKREQIYTRFGTIVHDNFMSHIQKLL